LDPFIIIDYETSNPHFNLAAEEYLLHHKSENVLFLYVNEPSVIIGKHQNAFDECQIRFCEEANINIVRRLSGGGTVFHGPGNLNFCFIKNGKDRSKLIDFKKHLEPVNAFLHDLGVPSKFSGRNDLLVDGFKISGNAEHVYSKQNRVIHHGTLLFDADLKTLNKSISAKSNINFETHAVKSVRSKVSNIKKYLPESLDFESFKLKMFSFLKTYFNASTYQFSTNEIKEINAISKAKYETWDWNFGYSPKFKAILSLQDYEAIELQVLKGKIDSVKCASNSLMNTLQGVIGQNFTQENFQKVGLEVVL
jgi:lipoate---protein ligase